jgi:hypothetical protein
MQDVSVVVDTKSVSNLVFNLLASQIISPIQRLKKQPLTVVSQSRMLERCILKLNMNVLYSYVLLCHSPPASAISSNNHYTVHLHRETVVR